ncbi:MAG: 30S ribosomal protein S18 [Myxococcaceae bacterium]|nr:30S ribosomal protein S18 [Myxococcaceae bacterium]MBH2006333.1 30S ribosomal protein S18 [Myxococcaceae bacterium]
MTNFTVADDPLNNPKNAVGGNRNRRRLADFFMQNKIPVDYHNTDVLRRFISPEGKILPGRRSGLTSKNQRKVMKAIKMARVIGLLPYVNVEY